MIHNYYNLCLLSAFLLKTPRYTIDLLDINYRFIKNVTNKKHDQTLAIEI